MCEQRHMPRLGGGLYDAAFVHEEATVRGLIENFSPEIHQISWKWIGGVFVFYFVIMAAAMGMLVVHQYQKNPTREPGIATAVAGEPRAVITMPAL
jgi:hypothetical protein